MCWLRRWGHSISIGYRASIKSSMKAQRSSDIPIPPSNPITPLPAHRDPLLTLAYILPGTIGIWLRFIRRDDGVKVTTRLCIVSVVICCKVSHPISAPPLSPCPFGPGCRKQFFLRLSVSRAAVSRCIGKSI